MPGTCARTTGRLRPASDGPVAVRHVTPLRPLVITLSLALVITLSLAVAHPPYACHEHAHARAHTHARTHTRAHVRTRQTRRRWTREHENEPRMQDKIVVSLPLAHPTHYTTRTTPTSDMTEITNATPTILKRPRLTTSYTAGAR